MARVTAGLPVYNGADYLDSALAALSAQDFPDFEILVSNNASTDGTADILAQWAAKEPRLRVFHQDENIGAARNYRWVIENAQSHLFMYAAHDDLWSPNYVSALHAALMASPGAQLAVPRLVTMMEDGQHDISRHWPGAEMATLGGAARVKASLRAANSAWYYGVAQKEAFLAALAAAKDYPHLWGADFVVLLPMILAAAVTGDDAAVYYKRQTPLSEERYRPKTAGAQLGMTHDFLCTGLNLLAASPLSTAGKAAVIPSFLHYCRHGGKMRRALKLALKRKTA